MMVSRKDFEAFAQWVADEELMGTEEAMVERFCKVLKSRNPKFDKERFITRCDELQDFWRGDLSFPISQDQMPLLALQEFERQLFNATAPPNSPRVGHVERKQIQVCKDLLLLVFPHLKEN